MKKIIYFSGAILLFAACTSKPKDKAAQLADLKKEQAKVDSQIVKLQTELGNGILRPVRYWISEEMVGNIG